MTAATAKRALRLRNTVVQTLAEALLDRGENLMRELDDAFASPKFSDRAWAVGFMTRRKVQELIELAPDELPQDPNLRALATGLQDRALRLLGVVDGALASRKPAERRWGEAFLLRPAVMAWREEAAALRAERKALALEGEARREAKQAERQAHQASPPMPTQGPGYRGPEKGTARDGAALFDGFLRELRVAGLHGNKLKKGH